MAKKAKAVNERVKVKNLPQKEQKLSKGEQKRVKGGIDGALNNHQTGALRNLSNNNTYDGCQQSTDGIIVNSGPGSGGHIRVVDGTRQG